MSGEPRRFDGDTEFPVPDRLSPLLAELDEFLRDTVEPIEEAYAGFLGDPLDYLTAEGRLRPELVEARARVREAAAEEGFYALHMPESAGGGGLGLLEQFYVQEYVFRHGTGHGTGLTKSVLAWTEGPAPVLARLGEPQRERWVQPLVEGRRTACFCVTEPEAGSDWSRMRTRARRDGDDWVLEGHKHYITGAPFADEAMVMARTDDGGSEPELTLFFVDTDNSGFEVGSINHNLMMDGLTAEVRLERCRVGKDQVIGSPGEGSRWALAWLNWRRFCRGGMCVGMGRYLLQRMYRHATSREQFGRPIGTHQAVQFPVVDTLTELHATRAFCERTIRRLADHTDFSRLREPPEVQRLVSMLKYHPEDRLFTWADRAIQVLGGLGLMRSGGVERVFRVARNLRIPAGTTAMQKRTVARTLGMTNPE